MLFSCHIFYTTFKPKHSDNVSKFLLSTESIKIIIYSLKQKESRKGKLNKLKKRRNLKKKSRLQIFSYQILKGNGVKFFIF